MRALHGNLNCDRPAYTCPMRLRQAQRLGVGRWNYCNAGLAIVANN
jgi:hypothetical protein